MFGLSCISPFIKHPDVSVGICRFNTNNLNTPFRLAREVKNTANIVCLYCQRFYIVNNLLSLIPLRIAFATDESLRGMLYFGHRVKIRTAMYRKYWTSWYWIPALIKLRSYVYVAYKNWMQIKKANVTKQLLKWFFCAYTLGFLSGLTAI